MQATENNIELMINDIYNTDFLNKNVLYRGTDVQLIDLDGKYIKNDRYATTNSVYSYFLFDMLSTIIKKLKTQYSLEEVKKIVSEIESFFVTEYANDVSIDYPIQVLKRIDRMQILK